VGRLRQRATRLGRSDRGSAVAIAAPLIVLFHAAPARCGAGVGEICDVDVPVANGFYWSESLGDLGSRSSAQSVEGVREVAWNERYVFAKTNEGGSWYVIDTTVPGAAGIQGFRPGSASWEQRLDEIGRPALDWRAPSTLPRPWWSTARCTVIVLAILGSAFWPYSLAAVVVPTVAFLLRRSRRQRR
jgi:hypothetical protein